MSRETLIGERKNDHLKICNEMDVEFRDKTTWLEEVHLIHEAVPELSFDEIDTSVRFMGKTLKAPLLIGAMSGGVDEAAGLNRDLARAAEELGIGFCLGSQRPMLRKPERVGSYEVRRNAPSSLVLGNIGLQQAAETPVEEVLRLVTGIGADGLALHLNPAQELVQPEGDRRFPNGYQTVRALAKRLPGKLLIKETGCGMSRSVAAKLKKAGARFIEISGAGGTSWPRVENIRKNPKSARRTWLDEWGIPTAASLLEVRGLGLGVVASGGLRDGLDTAKCLVLGANAAAMALPVLRAYKKGGLAGVTRFLQGVIEDLKSVMLLVGAKDVATLKKHRPVITGRLREWQTSRKPTAGK